MANFITLFRFPLLFVYLLCIYFGESSIILWCIPFIIIIFFLDTVDGYVARIRGEANVLGAAMDIATDRTLEIILWMAFADLNLVPVIIPFIVVVRGTMGDAIRSIGVRQGLAAFEQLTHPINKFLVSSRFMRNLYGIFKGLAFALLTLTLWMRAASISYVDLWHFFSLAISWAVIVLNIVRGLPIFIEGYKLFFRQNTNG